MIHDKLCFKMHLNHWYHKKKQPIAVDDFLQLVSATGHVASTTRRDIIIIIIIIIIYIVYSLYHLYHLISHASSIAYIYIYIYQSQIYISISQIYIIYHQLIHLSSSTIYLLSTINSTLCLVVTLTCGRFWGQSPDCRSVLPVLNMGLSTETRHTVFQRKMSTLGYIHHPF